jgi:hypothetical protein
MNGPARLFDCCGSKAKRDLPRNHMHLHNRLGFNETCCIEARRFLRRCVRVR